MTATPHPPAGSARLRRLVIAALAVLAMASLVIVDSTGTAPADDDHRAGAVEPA